MHPFDSLDRLVNASPRRIGETAHLLQQLKQAGHSIPPSWVIPADYFQQVRDQLVAREPLYGDWPECLWQHGSNSGYAVQALAKRLRSPLLSLSLNLPWSELLTSVGDYSVLRLVPSLWCGSTIAIAPFAEMLGTTYCWAEPEALDRALRQVWLSALSAKSLAFWSQWPATQSSSDTDYPPCVELAVIVQVVDPAWLSGTLTVRSDEVAITAVQGLSVALSTMFPQTYQGPQPPLPQFTWQTGLQTKSYMPSTFETILSTHAMESCLRAEGWPGADITVDEDTEQRLWRLAKQLTTWEHKPLQVEWSVSATTRQLHLLQAHWWPLQPFANPVAPALPPNECLWGQGAAPGQRQGRALVVRPEMALPPSAHDQIVIAAEVSPEWLPLLKTAAGVISERGGLTCHAAVLAREIGLPAIVGVRQATQRFQTGDPLAIDGDRGSITPLAELTKTVSADPPLPSFALDDATSTAIWLNLSQPEGAAASASLPVAGVGLLRAEWLMMPVLDRQHPYQWLKHGQTEALTARLVDQLRPILQAFAPRPVRYRTLDIRTSEFAQLEGAPAIEPNPMLGVRGTFSYRQQPAFFELELAVLKQLQDEGHTNLQLILPFVRTIEDVIYCRDRIWAAGLTDVPEFELWIMAEVPSVLFLLPDYVEAGVQGIAIGTHDLTQLLLGVDRDQTIFSHQFNEAHPAVQSAIAQLIRVAHQLRISCCLCGVSPIHHPDAVMAALQAGVPALSVDVSALDVTGQLLQQRLTTTSATTS